MMNDKIFTFGAAQILLFDFTSDDFSRFFLSLLGYVIDAEMTFNNFLIKPPTGSLFY